MSATKTQNHDAIEAGLRSATREIPILFSTPMVQAVLNGSKTQTRRTRLMKAVNEYPEEFQFARMEFDPKIYKDFQVSKVFKGHFAVFQNEKEEFTQLIKCPFGQPGDLLWVRETHDPHGCLGSVLYKADYSQETLQKAVKGAFSWNPSIHMLKTNARIWLQLEEIGVERLQNISHADALAEGVITHMEWLKEQSDSYNPDTKLQAYPVTAFSRLWDSINGKPKEGKPDCSWKANPWLWVVKFKVLSTTGKPAEL